MKSVENEWEQTAMKNAAAPIAAKTQQQIDRNNSKRWDWETALRLLNAQTPYPPGCRHYNAFVDLSWKDARINFKRSTCCAPSEGSDIWLHVIISLLLTACTVIMIIAFLAGASVPPVAAPLSFVLPASSTTLSEC